MEKDLQELLREEKVFQKCFSLARWYLCVGWSQALPPKRQWWTLMGFFPLVDSGCFPGVGWIYLTEGSAISIPLFTPKGILCVHCVQRQDP